MITVIGIFEEYNLAEDAASYLLGNDFETENIDIHTGPTERIAEFFNHLFEDPKEANAHILAAQNAAIVTVHAFSIREAQEAVDVLNNYGTIDVTVPGSADVLSRIVERPVNHIFRLRNE
jgi:hypothetical protein